MILYHLLCSHEHRFESWFRDSAAYDSMAAVGAVECPVCGDTTVRKALMAPAIGRKGATKAAPAPDEAAPQAPGSTAALMAGDHGKAAETVRKLAEALGQLQQAVQENCDYVGDRFAEEARRIHYGETETRGIYGETTREEADALREEGVAFASIPWRRPVS